MPTNANTFNSRVTSEALEAKFRQVFPSQGGAELTQDLFASGVIQPVVDFSTVAEGSVLPAELQQAWDFSTTLNTVRNANSTIINNTGFWKVDVLVTANPDDNTLLTLGELYIDSGLSTKVIWRISTAAMAGARGIAGLEQSFVVFLRAGDSLVCDSNYPACTINVWHRQIADVNGNLVNPLGFTFS